MPAAQTFNESAPVATTQQSAPHEPTATISAPGSDAEAEARSYIRHHESTNRLDAVNQASGSCGLYQSLPCTKLATDCPNWRTDRACQEAWGERYMLSRFHSWSEAKAYWLCIGTCTNKLGTITKTATWW